MADGNKELDKYIEAVRSGDWLECDRLRVLYHDDHLLTRFNTVDRALLTETAIFIREIQILRRERAGYKALWEGVGKKLIGDATPPSANSLENRGSSLLLQALEARDTHPEAQVEIGFSAV